MTAYELDLTDQEAGDYVAALRWVAESEGMPMATKARIETLCGLIDNQIPLPPPTKLAAVVRTDQNNCFIRWAYDAHTHEPWIAHSSVDETYRTDQIGRIVAVLSEGVEL